MRTEWIPDDVWACVASKLCPSDALSLGQTCRRMRGVCSTLVMWDDIRKSMRLRAPSKRPYKLVNSFRIVVGRACYRCRCRNRLRDVPLCSSCLQEQPMLCDSRQQVFRLRQSVQRRERSISRMQLYLETYMNMPQHQLYHLNTVQLLDAISFQNVLIEEELHNVEVMQQCIHDRLADHHLLPEQPQFL